MKTRKWLAVCISSLSLMLVLSPAALTNGMGRTARATSDSWQLSHGVGFGAAGNNAAAMSIVEFKGTLYAATVNSGGAQLWRKDGSNWSRATGLNMPDMPNLASDPAIVRMIVFNNRLYVGTININSGCGLWRFDGTKWEDALALTGTKGRGFGNNHNLAITAMEEFNGDLYVGTTNYVLDQISSLKLYTEGIHVFKLSRTADTWSSIDTSNLESRYNAGVTSFAVYNSRLYACTVRLSVEPDLTKWPSIPIHIVPKGFQFLRLQSSGKKFSVVADGGITDTNNIAGLCMKEYGGKLYIGTANATVTVVYNASTNNIDNIGYTSNGLSSLQLQWQRGAVRGRKERVWQQQ